MIAENQTAERPIQSLEERIEYSNATQFRKLFLSVLDELQGNTYLRYIITKHGEPRAVAMSFAAYNMMYRALQQLTKLQSEMSPADAATIALRQLEADEADSRGRSAEVLGSVQPAFLMRRLNAVVEEINDLRQLVNVVASENSCRTKAHSRKLIRTR